MSFRQRILAAARRAPTPPAPVTPQPGLQELDDPFGDVVVKDKRADDELDDPFGSIPPQPQKPRNPNDLDDPF